MAIGAALERARDIEWILHLEDGLEAARQSRRPVVVKPMGQGIGKSDDW
jgi:hypothetical protein